MTRAEVEEIVAHSRALIEAHERRPWDCRYATEEERQALLGVMGAIVRASDGEELRLETV